MPIYSEFAPSFRDILRFLRYADLNHLPCSREPASEFPRQKWVHGSLFVPIVGYLSTKLMVSTFGMFSHVSEPKR